MKAEELDKVFDGGKEDILPYLGLAKAVRPGHAAKRVNVDSRNGCSRGWTWKPTGLAFPGSRSSRSGLASASPREGNPSRPNPNVVLKPLARRG
jgi:hypothetical protein